MSSRLNVETFYRNSASGSERYGLDITAPKTARSIKIWRLPLQSSRLSSVSTRGTNRAVGVGRAQNKSCTSTTTMILLVETLSIC